MSAWPEGYTDLRELGSGASGTVMLARHEASGQHVAVKHLSERLTGDDAFLAGFAAEARLLLEVDDPHVVRLYEYVQAGRRAAMVLELVDGVSLRAVLREGGPLGVEGALAVLRGSLLGLAAAHDAGLVHRDYKPENVMVSGAGTTLLVDFGVAVRAGRSVPSAGTPDYMAPEQWAGGAAGAATDVYAATAVLVECLSGQRPYPGDGVEAVRWSHLNAPPPADRVPRALRPLVVTGMAKDPDERPTTARELLAALEEVAASELGPAWHRRGVQELQRRALALGALFPLPPLAVPAGPAAALTLLGRRALGVAALAAAIGLGGAAVVDRSAGAIPTAAHVMTASTVLDRPPPTASVPPLAGETPAAGPDRPAGRRGAPPVVGTTAPPPSPVAPRTPLRRPAEPEPVPEPADRPAGPPTEKHVDPPVEKPVEKPTANPSEKPAEPAPGDPYKKPSPPPTPAGKEPAETPAAMSLALAAPLAHRARGRR